MQNTDLPHCCETAEFRRITLCGKELDVKATYCSRDGISYNMKDEPLKLWVSICPIDFCAAECPFCIAGDTIRNPGRLNLKKLESALLQLKAAEIVNGVSITGGEPFTDVEFLNDVICLVYETLGIRTQVSLNTNGIGIHSLHRIKHLKDLLTIHISRHHWDDEVNRSIFGIKVPGGAELKEVTDEYSACRDLFVMNCMLMRDYVGTPGAAHRLLDHAISTGMSKVSFITGTPVNDFIRQQAVSFDEVLRDDDPALLFTRGFFDHGYCRCRDGIYAGDDGRLIEFYGRMTDQRQCSYARGLVYHSDDTLTAGFNGTRIL